MKQQTRLLIHFVVVALVSCAPKSRNDRLTTYDQKQTGDYNIQLHLKDFQIVALLSEDTLGAFGDYEYNYDYSDLTIKPQNNTTSKPLVVSVPSERPISSEKPETPASKPPTMIVSSSTPVPSTTTQRIPETSSYTPKTTQASMNNSVTANKNMRSDNVLSSTTEGFPNSERLGEKNQKVTSVTILPSAVSVVTDNNNNNGGSILNLGEILHYRKCPSGYSKDKRGRCRKTRRPGVLPYGLTRLASNLAAKFRQAVADGDSSSESNEE